MDPPPLRLPIAGAFAAVLLLGTALCLFLSQRQMAAIRRHRDRVPGYFADSIALADHQKAADYSLELLKLGRLSLVADTALTLALTLAGVFASMDTFWQRSNLAEPWDGALVVLCVVVLMALVDLPFSIWRTFRIEARFGFNRTTPALFVTDLLKSALIALLVGGPLVLGALALMARAGRLWWLWAWCGWLALMLLMTWAWPAVIAPLFNRFTALSDAALKTRVESLLQRCGFKSEGVFVVDGSRRSAHGNAYFTGLGRNKRIVFFDTLLASLTHSEVEGVLAHELGHFKLRHVRKRLLLTMVTSFAALALLGWLAGQPAFYSAFGVSRPSPHAALVLFMLVTPAFAFFATPLGARWSRRHEFEADDFAARHANAADLATALVKLYRDNASTLTPDPIYSAFYYSHPPATERIERLRRNLVQVDRLPDPLDRPVGV
jgi:STE24 endopeptidase